MIKRLLAVSTLLLATTAMIPAAQASTPQAARARPATRVIANCVHAVYEPKRIIIACADGNLALMKMKYQRWTAHEATGTGTMYVNQCLPNCADGKWVTSYTRFTLDRPEKVGKQLRFSRLIAVYPHHPGKYHREVYQLITHKI